MKIMEEMRDSFKKDAHIFYITSAMFFLSIIFFTIGKLGIGNDTLEGMLGSSRFNDFYAVFSYAPTIPDPVDAVQYSALSIIFGRIFGHHQLVGLIIILLVGIFLPIYLIRREILKFFDKNALIYIVFLISSYPILFAFFRGNPALIGSLWSILGVLSFISGSAFVSRYAFIFGSLFHPAPAIFSVLFLKDGIVSFIKMVLLIGLLQLLFYAALGKPLLDTLGDVNLSLEVYKAAYIIGRGGDMYGNSLFLPIKFVFGGNVQVLNIFLSFIPLFIFTIAFFKTYAEHRTYGRNSALFMFGLYFLPICLVIASPVSADYRLAYLLIPVMLMLLTRSFGLPFFLLLAVFLPKHFVYFHSEGFGMYPSATVIYPVSPTVIITTINAFLNPLLLLICMLLPNSEIIKFTHKLLKMRSPAALTTRQDRGGRVSDPFSRFERPTK